MKNYILLPFLLLLFSLSSFAQGPIEDCDCDWNTEELVCVSFFGDIIEMHPCDIECGLFVEVELFDEVEVVNCEDLIYGCTDPNALNYDENANANDGTCLYDNFIDCDCDWETEELVCVDFGGGEIFQLHPCEIECYDWFAELDIVDCDNLVYGCTDPNAENFNEEATVNDGSCEYENNEGCDCNWDTDELICVSFNGEILEMHPCEIECGTFEGLFLDFELYIVDCDNLIYGCTDPNAENYNEEATVNDGSCEYENNEGCDCDWETEELVCVDFGGGEIIQLHPCEIQCYDWFVELIIVDCDGLVYGCTDSTAENYNEDATANDGSCIYDNIGNCDCDWATDEYICISVNGEILEVHPCEIECGLFEGVLFEFEIEIVDCDNLVYGCTDPMAENYNEEANANDGSCVYDNIGNCDCDWNTEEYICISINGEILEVHPCELECGMFEDILFDFEIEIVDCDNLIYGCTDPNALNYNENATVNDGTCEYDFKDECDCDWTTDEWLCIAYVDELLNETIYFTVHQCDLECGFVDLDQFGSEYEIMDCDGDEGGNPGDDDVDWTDNYNFDFDQYVGDPADLADLLEEIISDGVIDEDELIDLVDIFIDLNIFPNPVEGTDIGINIESSEDLTANVFIINSLGQIVLEDHLELRVGQNRFELDAESLESGIYITRVITSSGSLVQEKFIKH